MDYMSTWSFICLRSLARGIMRLHALLAVLCVPCAAGGANPSLPHIHKGLMTKYEAKPPSSYGISLEGATTEQLRSGRPTVRFIETASGAKRVVSIQDIQATEKTIWKVITDLPNYPKMVEGCNMCAPYKREKLYSGGRVDYARYKIGAMGFKVEYFIKHMCAAIQYLPSHSALSLWPARL